MGLGLNYPYKLDTFRNKTKTTSQLFLALVTANGIKPTTYSDELISNVVTLEALFRES